MHKSMGNVLIILLLGALLVAAQPVAAAEKKVEVTLWHHWTGADRIAMVQQMLDQFNKLFPGIEAKQMSQGTAGAQAKLTSFIISGAAPEVVMISSGYSLSLIHI